MPDQGALAPLAAPVGVPGDTVRSSDVTLTAWRSGDGHLVFETPHAEPGAWIMLAVDEPGTRDTTLMSTPVQLDLFEVLAAHVGEDGKVTLATGTYAFPSAIRSVRGAASEDHSAHLGSWTDGFLVMEDVPNPNVRASVEWSGHGEPVLRLELPEDAARIEPGRPVTVLAFAGTGSGIPDSPFMTNIAPDAASFNLYPARDGESVAEAQRAAAGLARATEPVPSLVAVGGALTAVTAGLVLARALGGAAERRVLPRRASVLEHVFAAPRRVHAGRAVVLAALMVLPVVAIAPPAGAGHISNEVFPLPVRDERVSRDPCAPGAVVRTYNVSAIDMDIVFNRWGDHDPEGMMYVLDEELPAVLEERKELDERLANGTFPTGAEPSLITPLVLRARLGECVQIRFTNLLDPKGPPGGNVHPLGHAPTHAVDLEPAGAIPERALPMDPVADRRASIHVHGLPLDPRVSGTGAVGTNGDSSVPPGETITYRVAAVEEGIWFMHDHADPTGGGRIGFPTLPDFMRGSNVHGLFGAVVVEPPGATWTDAFTGEPLASGWRADIHVPGEESFREFVIFYHDPPIQLAGGGEPEQPFEDHGLNYRVETLSHRLFDDLDRCPDEQATIDNHGVNPCEDISMVYSSNVHGDPGTPIPRSYLGDKVVMRLAHAGMEETHVHHLHGHRWRAENDNPDSTRIDSQSITPGQTFTEILEAGAGGEGKAETPGDYIYHCHLFPHLYGGMWAIFRVMDALQDDLQPLPTRTAPPAPDLAEYNFPQTMQDAHERGHRNARPPQEPGVDPRTGIPVAAVGAPYSDPCPAEAPVRRYHLATIEVNATLNGHGDYDPEARIYAFAEDADAILAGEKEPDPVVLRIAAGECLVVHLENRFPLTGVNMASRIQGFGKVSIHPHLIEFDVQGTDGSAVGWNFDTTIWQGEEITYRYYADEEVNTIVWHDHANGLESAMRGMYGATIVEPPGMSWRNPETGGPVYTTGRDPGDGAFDSVYDPATGRYADVWRADIIGGSVPDFREFFASIQDHVMARRAVDDLEYRPQLCPECFDDFGIMGFNYRSEPLWHRVFAGVGTVFDSRIHGDPATNVWEAYPGDRVVVRFHQVAYEEQHTLLIDGHRWRFGLNDPGSEVVGSFGLGVSEAFNAVLECGAGGCAHQPGDYLYRGGALDDIWPGAWGLFRVHGNRQQDLLPLPDRDRWKSNPSHVCPHDAPVRTFHVVAMEAPILYNRYGDHDPNGLVYVLADEADAIRDGDAHPTPLTLRVAEGDCVQVRLTNEIPRGRVPLAHSEPHPTTGWTAPFTGPLVNVSEVLERRPHAPGNRVGFYAHLLTQDYPGDTGGRVGFNGDRTTPSGFTRVYEFYADVPPNTTAVVEDLGDVTTSKRHGLFGAIQVLPRGFHAVDPATGEPARNQPIADVLLPDGTAWRDVVLFQQSGIPLVNAQGQPIFVDDHGVGGNGAEEAVRAARGALRAFAPGTDVRAEIDVVRFGAPGFIVDGSVDGRGFRVLVTASGDVTDITFTDGPDPLPDRVIRVTKPNGDPLRGIEVTLERKGVIHRDTTDVQGLAVFDERLPPLTVWTATLGTSTCRIPVRTDFEGHLHVDARFKRHVCTELRLATAFAEAYLDVHDFATTTAGVTGVDVSGDKWYVDMEDALRSYRLVIDAANGRVLDFAFTAHAEPTGLPAFLPRMDVHRAAERFLDTHYWSLHRTLLAEVQDRFGTWHLDYRSTSPTELGDVVTSLRVDGQTGRVLSFARAPAGDPAPTPLTTTDGLAVRVRNGDGADLENLLVHVYVNGVHVQRARLDDGGLLRVPSAALDRARSLGSVVLDFPHLGLKVPVDARSRENVRVDLADLAGSGRVDDEGALSKSVEYLTSFRPLNALHGGGPGFTSPWALSSLHRAGDGTWHVGLALKDHKLTVRVDATTGAVRGATLEEWETPKDRCSGEPLEHMGPHPAPVCGSSFGNLDEEDQGAKGFNYGSEPYINRLLRNPDPALVYSSRVHGDPATPVIMAYPHDPVRIHYTNAGDKARMTGFSIDGHMWPRNPNDPGSEKAGGHGIASAFHTTSFRLVDGAGAGTGFAGDYLYQGAVQRFHVEVGEWGIMRVYDSRVPWLRALDDPLPGESDKPPGRVPKDPPRGGDGRMPTTPEEPNPGNGGGGGDRGDRIPAESQSGGLADFLLPGKWSGSGVGALIALSVVAALAAVVLRFTLQPLRERKSRDAP